MNVRLITILTFSLSIIINSVAWAQKQENTKPLFCAAYYYEYEPYERLEADVNMMIAMGINVVRIAESSWSTWEPEDSVFNFTKLDKVLGAMHKGGINVIVGTPTSSIPTWLAKEHPQVLTETIESPYHFDGRKSINITNKDYLFYAERIVKTLVNHVKNHPAVIGFQIDNNTQSYGIAGSKIHEQWKQYLINQYDTSTRLNKAWGQAYNSQSFTYWNELPTRHEATNPSYHVEWDRFQRRLSTQFLKWQAQIVDNLKLSEQFIIHNFDLEWRDGASYTPNPYVNSYKTASYMDIAGIDVYYDTQDEFDGLTISMAGDYARSLKKENYYVLETSAQSSSNRSMHIKPPYDKQARLAIYSHLASGANMIGYGNWHSNHHGAETYWKGLLGHDFKFNRVAREIQHTILEIDTIGKNIFNLKKESQAAILFSHDSFSGIKSMPFSEEYDYSDILRSMYSAAYQSNISCDIITPEENFKQYEILIVPPLYCASEQLLRKLALYVRSGGNLILSFKSGFTNENSQVRFHTMPGILSEAAGFTYQEFSSINRIRLDSDILSRAYAAEWMEFLIPTTADTLAIYNHAEYCQYPAITFNKYGRGSLTYIGTMIGETQYQEVYKHILREMDLDSELVEFPIIIKNGKNKDGDYIHYYMNYSEDSVSFTYTYRKGIELLSDSTIERASKVKIAPWDLVIIKE